jgi:uncharacterized protein DUF4337
MAEADGSGEGRKSFEVICGVLIAAFAAVLAITDLGAGKYGDDELIAHNEKSGAYLWYQSKGIKETLAEGQRDTLQALVAAGAIRPEQLPTVEGLIHRLDGNVKRYGKEKAEILHGSKAVGPASWAQDVDGKLGQVVGAKEWEAKANTLNEVGDTFDYATFFLQLCLVFGAISLVIQRDGMQRAFFWMMNLLGLIGAAISAYAFYLASHVP